METELYYCKQCKKWVEPIVETGYESGPFPDAYEDYYKCPTCRSEVKSEYEMEEAGES